MQCPSTGPRGRGVTLIEMCVVLGIVALILGQLIPSLQRRKRGLTALWRTAAVLTKIG